MKTYLLLPGVLLGAICIVLAAPEDNSTSKTIQVRGASCEVKEYPDGTRMISLANLPKNYAVLRTDPDGTREIKCLEEGETISEFLSEKEVIPVPTR